MALFGKEKEKEKGKEKDRTITIPESLAVKIDQRIKGSAFPSASAYIVYVLNEVLGEGESEGFSAEDEEIVKKRLRSLGYLD
jgi:Arc/MetJ-type ribon-helix-helix transcriptional regulator